MRRHIARTAASAALVTLLSAVLPAGRALALSVGPDRTWGTNGKVFALAHYGTTVYVGGTFDKVASPDGSQSSTVANLAAFNMTTGAWISTFKASVTVATSEPSIVRALGVSPDGRTLYVGGHFDAVDGQPEQNLAAVDATTGALKSGFATKVSNVVNAILVGPTRVYFGGTFARVDSKPRTRLAAVSLDGTLDPNWVPSADNTIRSLALSTDGKTVFVGGKFASVDGQPRDCIARVAADTGALDPWRVPSGVIDSGNMAWTILPTATGLYVGFGQRPELPLGVPSRPGHQRARGLAGLVHRKRRIPGPSARTDPA